MLRVLFRARGEPGSRSSGFYGLQILYGFLMVSFVREIFPIAKAGPIEWLPLDSSWPSVQKGGLCSRVRVLESFAPLYNEFNIE